MAPARTNKHGDSEQVRPGSLQVWMMAVRPKTLSIAAVPVMVGNALAWSEVGVLDPLILLVTLISAIAIQAGTNLYNDAADYLHGADQADRIGPVRVTAQGWVKPEQVKAAAMTAFAIAVFGGLYLSWIGGWVIVVIGLLSLLAGWGYSGGPRPIAYTPFGEVFVFCFFGVAAVSGSYYLQAGAVSDSAPIAGGAIGLLAAAVLHVNNYRDREQDGRAGRRTLAVLVNDTGAKAIFALLMTVPFLVVLALFQSFPAAHGLWLVMAAALPALLLVRQFWHEPVGPAFNGLLAGTAGTQALFAILLCAGLLL